MKNQINQNNQVSATETKQVKTTGYTKAQEIVMGAKKATPVGKVLAVNDIIKTGDLDGIESFIYQVQGLTVDQVSRLASALMDLAYAQGDDRIQTRLVGLVQHSMGALDDATLNKLMTHIQEENLTSRVMQACARKYIKSYDVEAMLQFAEAFGSELNKKNDPGETSAFDKLGFEILALASESQAKRFYSIKTKIASQPVTPSNTDGQEL